ncbi:MAG: hypothetical protein ACXWT3_02250, partial [Methylococcaceae bacterium]
DTLIGGLGADVIDLTESLAVNDIVKVNIGDSNLNAAEADRIIKFAFASDTLDLAATTVAASVAAKDGIDASGFKSHSITNGFMKFDDADTFSSALSITSSNISGALDYLKTNITDGSTVAFLGTAVDPNSTTSASVSSTWVFQDNGATDTLIALVGVTSATSVSNGAFSATAIHLA